MSYDTEINLKSRRHGLDISTTTGTLESHNDGAEFQQMVIATEFVTTRTTHFESNDGWTTQSIHLYASPDVSAYVHDEGSDPYLVVKVGHQRNLFVPMNIVAAIVDALAQKKSDDDEAFCAAVTA